MAMGWMRPTANGVLFLGCRSWMWAVCGKWWFKEGGMVGMGGMVGFD